MAGFKKMIYPARWKGERIFCRIEYNGVLRITGAVNPTPSGNSTSCGQICDYLIDHDTKPNHDHGWNKQKLQELYNIWMRWHLNDCIAGSPKQEAFLRELVPVPKDYLERSTALKEAGLYEDVDLQFDGKPYRYGSAWLSIPDTVVNWLFELPSTNLAPIWVVN